MLSTQQKSTADRPWLDPDAKPQIVIESVNKTFGAFSAVDSVNLRIYKGEMFALVGASGCGKTTLLRMLAGFTSPSGGRILIEDVDMTSVPPHERPVNMMFQSYALFPHMSVEQNVGYGLRRMALESSVRYLAADFGPQGVRVNAISAGPVRTLAGAGIADARFMFNFEREHSPLRRTVTIEDVGGAALYLLSPLSSGVTGEIHYVDAGYNIISMPHPDDVKTSAQNERGLAAE